MNALLSNLIAVLLLAVVFVVVRALWGESRREPVRWWPSVGIRILSILALLVLMRPHEEWIGGQDGGAYMNLGARFASTEKPIFQDPLLPLLRPGDFDAFRYYAHNTAYLTKYGTEWVRDPVAGLVGPWFQPAFPLLLSWPVRLGWPYGAALLTPLLAWLNGWLLALVVMRLRGRRGAGLVAAVLYWFNPLVVWHARAPRPEFIASFLLLAAVFLLMPSVTRGQPASWRVTLQATLGACGMALAPFFHITAWMAALPMAGWAAWQLGRGNRALAAYPVAAAAGLMLFCAQIVNWSDTYGLRRFVVPLIVGHSGWISMVVLFAVAGGAAVLLLRLARPAVVRDDERPVRVRGWCAAGLLGFVVGMASWALATRPTVAMHYVQTYVNRTDVMVAVTMVSRWLTLLAVPGLVLLAGAASRNRAAHAGLFFTVLIPPAFFVGNMYDFFMTRYLVTAWVPLLVAGLAIGIDALISRLAGNRLRWIALLVVTLMVVAVGLRGKKDWITVREYEGFFAAAGRVAEPVKAADGILLVEYARLGSVFDHTFGIPTLSLNNERIDDRLQELGEDAWADLLRRLPERKAFLLTPYEAPVSERFVLTPVLSETVEGSMLVTRRWNRPGGTRPWGLAFNLYAMTLRDRAGEAHAAATPYRRFMDDGRFGLRGFHRTQYRAWGVPFLSPEPDGRYRIDASVIDQAGEIIVRVFFHDEQAKVGFRAGERALAVTELGQGWRMAHGRFDPVDGGVIPDQAVRVNTIWLEAGGRAVMMPPASEPSFASVGVFPARPAGPGASVTLPPTVPDAGMAVWALLPEEAGASATLRLGDHSAQHLPTGRWHWSWWPGVLKPGEPVTLTLGLDDGGERPFEVMLGGVAILSGTRD